MTQHQPHLRIGIVSGEASGDLLGASLVSELKKSYPNISFEGIAGPKMKAQGVKTLYDIDELNVIGIKEVILKLPKLLKIKRAIANHFIQNPPDIFIGIDYSDFNLSLSLKLRKHGIKTVQYKSPSVWAWREGRVKKIRRALDLVLTLFPFEQAFFEKKNVPSTYIGHALADDIPFEIDTIAYKQKLSIDPSIKVIALLPGSRSQELTHMTKTFIESAALIADRHTNVTFITTMVNEKRVQQFNSIVESIGASIDLKVFQDRTEDVLGASDAVLLASGTVTLEALLYKKPMVVVYKTSKLTLFVIRKFLTIPFISLPNLLANKKIVPEIIQKDATPKSLSLALNEALSITKDDPLIKEYENIHITLRQNANQKAAEALLELI